MEAVKRAYAEMILNTAKEAAARVMAAELRARRSEHDLVSTKDDAARMLLYLKQMIDAKDKEVKFTSLNQQKKIDVLESQLSEAEGIIIDLRAELNHAHERLDEVKNKKLDLSRHNDNANAEVRNMTPENTNSGHDLISDLDQLKETELLKNVCSQRICATETSLVEDRFLVGDELNPNTNSTGVEIGNGVSASELEEKARRGDNEEVASIIRRRSLRKRKLKFLDDVFTACGLDPSCQFKRSRAFSMSRCCNSGNVKSSAKSCEDRVEAEDGAQMKEP